MHKSTAICLSIGSITVLGYALWPEIEPYLPFIKQCLTHFRSYCRANPVMSYVVYTAVLSTTILAGLPLSTLWMLAAGLFYSFWEAAALVTFTRLLAAVIAFMITRRLIETPVTGPRSKHFILRMLERHPNMGLFLARLAPIPDGVVNYTSAAAPIGQRDYLVISLVGMIPFTLFAVWTGAHLGSISGLIHWVD